MFAGRPELIIFDCDGVLVDSEPLSMRVLAATMSDLGISLSSDDCYRHFLGRSISSMKSTLDQQFGRKLTDADLSAMRERLFDLYAQELEPIAGIAEVLGDLTVPYCVASSSLPERIKLSLDLTGLSVFFGDHVFSATMVEHGKPAPDLFLHAARRMGAHPERCIVIEDSPAGLEAARRANMRSFAFLGGSHAVPAGLASQVAAQFPSCIFDDMDQLPNLIAQLERTPGHGIVGPHTRH